MQRRET
jgi:hypothetical protein